MSSQAYLVSAVPLSALMRALSGSIGYNQEEADMLSVAAADFSGFMRQKQRGWAVESKQFRFSAS